MKIGSDGGAENSLGRRRKEKRVTEERVSLWRCVAIVKISREGGAENSLARRRRKRFTEERVSLENFSCYRGVCVARPCAAVKIGSEKVHSPSQVYMRWSPVCLRESWCICSEYQIWVSFTTHVFSCMKFTRKCAASCTHVKSAENDRAQHLSPCYTLTIC